MRTERPQTCIQSVESADCADRSIKKFNNREYAYIVENDRDPSTKRPTSRTLESDSRLDKLLAADPDALKKA